MSIAVRVAFVSLPLSVIFMAGCAMTSSAPIHVTPAGISGRVFGGQQPVAQSTVTVWQVGTVDYGTTGSDIPIGSAMTDAAGHFTIAAYDCTAGGLTPTTQVYVTAQGGDAGSGPNDSILLASGLGNCSSAETSSVEINEVTTAVTAFALNNFVSFEGTPGDDYISAPPAAASSLALSNTYTIPTLVNLETGAVNPNTSSITIDAAKIYSIANALGACVNSNGTDGACTSLFFYTAFNLNMAVDTFQAAVLMAYYPFNNTSGIWKLGTKNAPFAGGLSSAPNDWTIGVAYTTNSLGLNVAGTTTSGSSSNIDIDTSGNVWFPSNATGAVGAAYFSPVRNTFNGPFGSTGITMPQYLAIDQVGGLWMTDQGSGNINTFDTTSTGSVTSYSIKNVTGGPINIDFNGLPLFVDTRTSGPELAGIDVTYSPGVVHPTLSSFMQTPSGLVTVLDGDEFYIGSTSGPTATPCAAEEIDDGGPGYSSDDATTGITSTCQSGGAAVTLAALDVVTAATTLNKLCSAADEVCFTPVTPVNLPEGVATDGGAETWVANSGEASVTVLGPGYGPGVGNGTVATPSNPSGQNYFELSPVSYQHGANAGGTMTAPYGVAIDGSGNVWVSNASCISPTVTLCVASSFTLSEVIGAGIPTITPLSDQCSGYYAGAEPGEGPTTPGSCSSVVTEFQKGGIESLMKSSGKKPWSGAKPRSVVVRSRGHVQP